MTDFCIRCRLYSFSIGKTKLLDKIRNTNVQEGEAGGITQQIGATQFPRETLALQTNAMQKDHPFEIKLPGLLVIDTPGHESFTNLRNRGSSLCDVAILVIDLMHGLEQQTIESINLLRRKNAPFIVALNKVDRLYGWKKLPDGPIREAFALQDENCLAEFKDRSNNIILQLNQLGLNAKMYWENDSLEDTVSLVPTSAMSGEGVPDLLMNVIQYAQNQLQEKLMYFNYMQCTVLEVKVIEGLGPSIDVVLLNGVIREGDRIVVSTMEGPIMTTVRALLTPPPNREMRIKSEYIHHQSVQGAMGVKIVAPDLNRAVAGTPLMVVHKDDDEEELMEDVQSDLSSITKLSTDSKGVTVHASTLGALEALLQFLQKECKPMIPVSAVSIGTIFKRDVMRAAIMNDKGFPEYATILAFDVHIDNEAQSYAEESNVRIFKADIIYHLFDQFSRYMTNLMETRKAEAIGRAVFPCVLKIFPQHIFNKKDPIVIGVEVLEGTLKVQTPLHIPQIGLDVGRVVSIENNHKDVTQAKKGTNVSIKITCERYA
jgi:translation initiation factor 5B